MPNAAERLRRERGHAWVAAEAAGPFSSGVLGLTEADQERLAAQAREEMDRRVRRFRGEDGLPDVKERPAPGNPPGQEAGERPRTPTR